LCISPRTLIRRLQSQLFHHAATTLEIWLTQPRAIYSRNSANRGGSSSEGSPLKSPDEKLRLVKSEVQVPQYFTHTGETQECPKSTRCAGAAPSSQTMQKANGFMTCTNLGVEDRGHNVATDLEITKESGRGPRGEHE
jgi:hypothetical protein